MSVQEIAYGDRDEWLKLRRGFIGGSDAAAVIGLDDYKSPYSLWAEKTGRVPEFDGNITTRVGSYLEELVAKMFSEETGKVVRRKNRMLVNDDYPFACADLDRVVVGEKALLECKTTTSFPVMRQVKGGEYPDRWYCQMTHYLGVTGYDRAYLAVLINCRDFKVFSLERDEAEIAALMDAERDFCRMVEEDRPPAVDGSQATTETLETIYANSVPVGTVDLFGFEHNLEHYFELKAVRDGYNKQIAAVENEIKEAMGAADRGAAGRYNVTWKTQTRTTFQAKEFAKDHPDVALDDYYKTTSSRPFKVTVKDN